MILKKSIENAEKNARIRDAEIDREKFIDLKTVSEIEEKANKLGYGLYKIKDVNQASFTQIISDNWDIIIRSNYLTTSELSFLISIQSLIQFHTNAIVDKETGEFMTVSEIARYLNRNRSGVSQTIQSLISKGVLFEFVNVDEIKQFNRNVTARTLFMNPELFYAGDRNRIDGTLALLVCEYDKLEKNGIRLEWKVMKKPNEQFGKLYKRKTYLEAKKKRKVESRA